MTVRKWSSLQSDEKLQKRR